MERHMPRGAITESDVGRIRWLVVLDVDGNEMGRTKVDRMTLREDDFLDLAWHLVVVSDDSARAES